MAVVVAAEVVVGEAEVVIIVEMEVGAAESAATETVLVT